jgi:hypothetical protein
MSRKIRNLLLALAVLFVPALLSFLVLSMRRPPRPPVPNPNGYVDFFKAAALVTGDILSATNRENIQAALSANAEPLRLIRLGITRRCQMPMDSVALTNAASTVNRLGDMKRLCQLLIMEGRLRELENQPGNAARSYADAISFGNEISRGGMLITRLVGIACETMGCRALAKVLPQIDGEDARLVVAELEGVDGGRVTWAEVMQDERYHCRLQLGPRVNPILWVVYWIQTRFPNQAVRQGATKQILITTQERLLTGELALRCYQAEQARLPARLEDLTTNCLSRVPRDPFSGLSLIYRPQGTNWLLYSVGEDGVDDGGKPTGRRTSGTVTKGDLFYDSL